MTEQTASRMLSVRVIIVGYVQVWRLRKRVKAIEDAAPTLDERKQWEAAVRKILGG